VQHREPGVLERHAGAGPSVAVTSTVTEGFSMLMFKRSQLYVGLGLAAIVEIIIRVVAH